MAFDPPYAEARQARVAERSGTADVPTLRRDPVTGAYRPG